MLAKGYISRYVATALALLLAQEALGQVPPPVAPTREEVQRDGLAPDAQSIVPREDIDGGIERAPCPLSQPRFSDIEFQLSGVRFSNLVGVSEEELRTVYAEYLNRTIPIDTICEIRDRAATLLRNRGFLAAIQVPPQEIGDDGIVRLDILSARMTRIQVRGDAGNSEGLIASYLEPLTEQDAFNQREAERSLLLARNLPGYETRLTLRPAEGAPGEVIGDVRVIREKFSLEGNIQNYSAPSSGRFGGQVRAQVNDVTGLGDRTVLGFYSTADFDESLVLTFAHDFAIGDNGLRLGGEFTYAWNDPTLGGISPFDTRTLVATGRLSYPFILDQGTFIGATTGFEFIDQQIDFADLPLNEDNLRVAFARVDASFTDRLSVNGYRGYSAAEPRWRLGLSGELRQGLDIFGASDAGLPPAIPVPQTRSAGQSDATLFRLEGLAEVRPTPNIALILQPRLQLTSQALLAYEEFSGGNYTIGRGYDPGAIIGDRGFGFRSETRIGSALPRNRDDLAIQPYAFFDAAWIDNDDPGAAGFGGSDELYSAGAGVRANWGGRVRFDTALAIPLRRTDSQTSTPDPRLLISITVGFGR